MEVAFAALHRRSLPQAVPQSCSRYQRIRPGIMPRLHRQVGTKVSSGRTGLLLSRPLRTVHESFQLTQLKPFERLVEKRGNDWSPHLHDTHLEPTHIPLCGLARPHQQFSLSSSALPRKPVNQVFSCERPEGSLPAFAVRRCCRFC